MANLFRSVNSPVLDWFPKEIPCGKDKMPLDPNYVPRVPDQIKIALSLKISEDKEKEFSFHVTPFDKESVEFFLTRTWDQFNKAAKAKMPSQFRTDGPTHFQLLPLALGVTATTKWNKVLNDQDIDPDLEDNEPSKLSYKKFELCLQLFLEEVAAQKYLGDGVIRWLRRGRRPFAMSTEVFFDRRETVLALLETGLLRSRLPHPNAYELAESVFLAFPVSYQEKYSESHEDIGEDLAPIKAAFSQYFAADVKNDVIKSISDKKEKKRPADSSGNRSHKRGRRPDKYSSGRGRRGGDRDRRDGYHRSDRDRHHSDRYRDDRRGRDGNHRPPKDGNHRSGGHQGQGKPYKPDNHAHHMDDGSRGSRSRSASSSPARSRSPDSRDGSVRDENEAYAMAIDRDHRGPQDVPVDAAAAAPVDNLTYDDEVRSQHNRYYGSRVWDKFVKKSRSRHSR